MTEGRGEVEEPCLGFDSDGVPFGDCMNCGLSRGVHPPASGRSATPGTTTAEVTPPAVCGACGSHRDPEELRQAYTLSWEPVPDRLNCVDADACFDAWCRRHLTKETRDAI